MYPDPFIVIVILISTFCYIKNDITIKLKYKLYFLFKYWTKKIERACMRVGTFLNKMYT